MHSSRFFPLFPWNILNKICVRRLRFSALLLELHNTVHIQWKRIATLGRVRAYQTSCERGRTFIALKAKRFGPKWPKQGRHFAIYGVIVLATFSCNSGDFWHFCVTFGCNPLVVTTCSKLHENVWKMAFREQCQFWFWGIFIFESKWLEIDLKMSEEYFTK